jgi:hypothetical protein
MPHSKLHSQRNRSGESHRHFSTAPVSAGALWCGYQEIMNQSTLSRANKPKDLEGVPLPYPPPLAAWQASMTLQARAPQDLPAYSRCSSVKAKPLGRASHRLDRLRFGWLNVWLQWTRKTGGAKVVLPEDENSAGVFYSRSCMTQTFKICLRAQSRSSAQSAMLPPRVFRAQNGNAC